eukprot:COSAG01_NODE_212_length_21797_cov_14.197806_20_plen_354_part_00
MRVPWLHIARLTAATTKLHSCPLCRKVTAITGDTPGRPPQPTAQSERIKAQQERRDRDIRRDDDMRSLVDRLERESSAAKAALEQEHCASLQALRVENAAHLAQTLEQQECKLQSEVAGLQMALSSHANAQRAMESEHLATLQRVNTGHAEQIERLEAENRSQKAEVARLVACENTLLAKQSDTRSSTSQLLGEMRARQATHEQTHLAALQRLRTEHAQELQRLAAQSARDHKAARALHADQLQAVRIEQKAARARHADQLQAVRTEQHAQRLQWAATPTATASKSATSKTATSKTATSKITFVSVAALVLLASASVWTTMTMINEGRAIGIIAGDFGAYAVQQHLASLFFGS